MKYVWIYDINGRLQGRKRKRIRATLNVYKTISISLIIIIYYKHWL